MEGGGVEVWTAEVLRRRFECPILIEILDVYKNDLKINISPHSFVFISFSFFKEIEGHGVAISLTPRLIDKTCDVVDIFHGLINTMNQTLGTLSCKII